MNEDESVVIHPKDPSAIVKLQDPTVIEQILENPLPVLAEVVTGYFMTGKRVLGRIRMSLGSSRIQGAGVPAICP
jgi:hypothetical protein